MRAIRLVLGALLLLPLFAVLPATSASAHDACVSQGSDVACVRYYHQRIDACDREADGHGVYAVALSGVGDRWTVTDANGAQPGCSQLWVSNPPIRYFQVCERVPNVADYCSPRTPT